VEGITVAAKGLAEEKKENQNAQAGAKKESLSFCDTISQTGRWEISEWSTNTYLYFSN